MDSLYTKSKSAKFRGPTTSDDYNTRVEDLYKDLTYLYNKIGISDEDQFRAYGRLVKEHFALCKTLEDAISRLAVLEAASPKLGFETSDQIDIDRFAGTTFEISAVDQCHFDSQHGIVILPKVESSSVSQLKFLAADNTFVVPSTFEALVVGDNATADSVAATIDTSDPYFAVVNQTGKIWERNVVVNAPFGNGSKVNLYIRLPSDLSVSDTANCIILHPFPITGCSLVEVAYSTATDIALNDTDGYIALNSDAVHSGDSHAVGWIAPGGWNGDKITNCGPKAFYFDPKAITAIRITLEQKNYYADAGKIIYSYGLSKLDVRSDKLLDTGKTIIRVDAPSGGTISSVESVVADLWNVPESQVDDVFSYRIIWETAFNSGIYTTNEVSLSKRVWVEVTMNKTIGKGTPSLSGLTVNYTA